ncbi:energy transducer TonB [Aurantiacibacter xanthus]|nr:energy transducer TonB [Aurantiacibacter xanthus]
MVLAAIVAGHCVLLAVAASAFRTSLTHIDRETPALVALFEKDPVQPAAAPRPEQPASARPSPPPPAMPSAPSGASGSGGAEPVTVAMVQPVRGPAIPLEVTPFALAPRAGLPEPASIAPPAPGEPDLLVRYAGVLRTAIMAWAPRGLHKEGEAVVSFRIDRSGQVLDTRIMRSSGDVQLDRLALRMVRQAAPFPPPDGAISDERLGFTIPIHFH